MLNLTRVLELTEQQKAAIQELIDEYGELKEEHWRKRERTLRIAIRSSLMVMQNNFCVYCGCPTFGAEDVEHIAHKADYPQFVFTPKNLAYSCKMCNQSFKGDVNVVTQVDPDYDKCKFNIVHPYLDDVEHYFDTTKAEIGIRSGLSAQDRKKAEDTKKLLHWKEPEVRSRRAHAAMAQKYTEITGINIVQALLDETLTYKPGIV